MAEDRPSLSIRIDLPDGTRFGPGKAWLLAAIKETGSIASAAKTLEMSYPRALKLVDEMNTQFRHPLIEKFQGGSKRGGSCLTSTGEIVLQRYTHLSDLLAKQSHAELTALFNLTDLGS